jgi:hypothetical protein
LEKLDPRVREGRVLGVSAPRRSRFSRTPELSPMILQDRDVEILKTLYDYRFLTTTQTADLFFNSKSKALRRLRQLYDNGFVARIFRPVVVGSAEIIYCLDNHGVNVLAQSLGVDREEIDWSRRSFTRLKSLFLDHALEVNQFRVAIHLATLDHADIELLFWKYDNELQTKNERGILISDRVTDPDDRRKKIRVTPDAFFGLSTSRGRAYFFLEADLGTEDNYQFKKKMQGYLKYYIDGHYQQKYGYKAFRVLTTTAAKRLPNLTRTTQKAVIDRRLHPIFYFADREYISPDHIFHTIWQTPGEPGTMRSIL